MGIIPKAWIIISDRHLVWYQLNMFGIYLSDNEVRGIHDYSYFDFKF